MGNQTFFDDFVGLGEKDFMLEKQNYCEGGKQALIKQLDEDLENQPKRNEEDTEEISADEKEVEGLVFEPVPRPRKPKKSTFMEVAEKVAAVVESKDLAYGKAFDQTASFLELLFPEGIDVSQYGKMLYLVRIFDKLKRIATSEYAFGENPAEDICGYSLLYIRKCIEEKEQKK